MTKSLPALALGALLGLAPMSAGADFAAGAQAYDGGDYAAAYRAWRKLAEKGDAEAQTAIAGMYRYGEGRPPDFEKAMAWYRRAADQGEPVAQMNLGEMHLRGLGVPRDPVEAYVWFHLAARQGRSWAAEQQSLLEARLTPAQRRAARAKIADRQGPTQNSD